MSRCCTPSEAAHARRAIGGKFGSHFGIVPYVDHRRGKGVVKRGFGLVGCLYNDAAGGVNKRSRAAQIEADDRKLCAKGFQHHESSGVVQAREDKSSMFEICVRDVAVRKVRNPVDMGSHATVFCNSLEPLSIFSFADDSQARIGKVAQDFRHCSKCEMNAFPIQKTSDKEKTRMGWRPVNRFCHEVDSDRGQYGAFGMEPSRDAMKGFRRGAGNQSGLRKRAAHAWIYFYCVDEYITQCFAQPSGVAQSCSQRTRRCLATADRSKDERNFQAAHKRGLAKGHKSDVVHQIKRIAFVDSASAAIGAELPKQVVNVQPAGPVLKISTPRGEVIGNRSELEFAFRAICLNTRDIIFTRNHRDVVSHLGESQEPIPADSRLGAPARLACVCRQKDLHNREMLTISVALDNSTIRFDDDCGVGGSE